MKYLYYERYYIRKGAIKENYRIQNVNGLLFKPYTNSSGFWGYTNVTEQKRTESIEYCVVDQMWIDLEKYKFDILYIMDD